MFRGIALAVGLVACSPVSNDASGDPALLLDEAVFRCNVEPVLAKYCSYTACHGIDKAAGPALRVYTPGKLRASAPANFEALISPLTDAEHHANFESAAGFSWNVTTVEDNFLLRKPLPSSYGGYEHQGGAIFSGAADPSYVAIRDWLAGKGNCP